MVFVMVCLQDAQCSEFMDLFFLVTGFKNPGGMDGKTINDYATGAFVLNPFPPLFFQDSLSTVIMYRRGNLRSYRSTMVIGNGKPYRNIYRS